MAQLVVAREYRVYEELMPLPRTDGIKVPMPLVRKSTGSWAMGTRQTTVDASSPAQIAKAIVKVNQALGLRHIGLDTLWKLYYAPNHTLMRAELEIEFGVLEDHFGLYCRRVAEALGANDPDALSLVNSSSDEHGFEVLTLKPSVVTAIKSHAFSK
jgi:hypothetical protein